jgi:hypothetical protein
MTIKTNEFWTDEDFSYIEAQLIIDTRPVKFGIFNFFKKGFESYPRPWIGEINRMKQTFKLFRTKGTENTSDLSVVGHYTIRGGKPVVVVKHKLHFTIIFGALGLLVAVLGCFVLVKKKGIIVSPAIQAVVFAMVILYYIYTIAKDLRDDEKQIKETLSRVLRREEDDYDEDVESEDEEKI